MNVVFKDYDPFLEILKPESQTLSTAELQRQVLEQLRAAIDPGITIKGFDVRDAQSDGPTGA